MNYLFNNKNLNEYLGQTDKNYSDCTTKVKPPEYQEHTLPCWNPHTKSWDSIIEDYRTLTAYQKTNSKIKYVVCLVGPISNIYTLTPPPDEENWYEFNNGEWKLHIERETKENLSNWLYQQKCQIAYTGVYIIQNGIQYTFETSLDSITLCNSTAFSLVDKELTYKLYWKVWKGKQTTFIQLTKSQFIEIFSFGMTMINQAFGVQSDRNIIVNAMTDEQLADKQYIQSFKTQSLKQFNAVNKTYELVTLA